MRPGQSKLPNLKPKKNIDINNNDFSSTNNDKFKGAVAISKCGTFAAVAQEN